MLKHFRIIVLSCLASALVSLQSHADIDQFIGHWINQDKSSKGLAYLKIKEKKGRIQIRAGRNCDREECRWGKSNATIFADSPRSDLFDDAKVLKATFRINNRLKTILITPKRQQLKLQVFTEFSNNRRSPYVKNYVFIKKPQQRNDFSIGIGGTGDFSFAQHDGDCISFNAFSSQVIKKNGEWQIRDGQQHLFSFDDNKSGASKALQMLRSYHIDQQCFVGRPKPSMTYLLSRGRAPEGRFEKEQCVKFDNDKLAFKRGKHRWEIVDGKRTLYKFGSKSKEAHQALDILKTFDFSYKCKFGETGQEIEYLRR